MPFPLHFKPLPLPFSTIASSSLPPSLPGCLCWLPQSQLAAPHAWFSLLEGCAALCGVSHPRGILHITAPAGPLLTGEILPAHKGTSTKDPCFPTPGYRLGKKWNKIITIRLVTKSWREGLAAAAQPVTHAPKGCKQVQSWMQVLFPQVGPSALYSQNLPTQRWDKGSKHLRRLGGSTQLSSVSASITTFNGVLKSSSGQRVGISKYQI